MTDAAPAIFHDVELGVSRLLSAPRDLPGAIDWTNPGPLAANASHAHRMLFERYVQELRWAVGLAVTWWNALVRQRMERGETEGDAIRANYELRPAGPAARPEVVWVVRSYWLECCRLNMATSVDYRIPPEVMLLKWLRVPEHDEFRRILSGMPFWPIGFDENGSFV